MAKRYIDADACGRYLFGKIGLADVINSETVLNYMADFTEQNTVDVVPRAEVAREIFAEIDRELVQALRSNYRVRQEQIEKNKEEIFIDHLVEGKIAALRGMDDFLAELKKKYTEDEK